LMVSVAVTIFILAGSRTAAKGVAGCCQY